MVLYDNNYKFIGISNDTLRFLGYEDVDEFCALHSDFANIFVQKEGFIYKYKNFSWIDYILYSGASQKQALLTLKNGREVKAEINIKEIFLTGEISNSNKYYFVDLASDFINAQSDNSAPVQVNRVDFQSMIGDDNKPTYNESNPINNFQGTESPAIQNEIVYPKVEENIFNEDKSDEEFKISLNFDESIDKNFLQDEPDVETFKQEPIEDLVKIESDLEQQNDQEPEINEEEDFLLNFIKHENSEEFKEEKVEENDVEIKKEHNDKEEKEFSFNFSEPEIEIEKSKEVEVEEEPSFTLDFLKKPKENDIAETVKESIKEVKEEDNLVPFIKPQIEIEESKEPVEEPSFTLDFLKKPQEDDIAATIKESIEEVKEEDNLAEFIKPEIEIEESKEVEEEPPFSLDFLKKPQETQTVEEEKEEHITETVKEEDFFSLNTIKVEKEEVIDENDVKKADKAPLTVSDFKDEDNDFFSLKALHIESDKKEVQEPETVEINTFKEENLKQEQQEEKVVKDVLQSSKPALQSVDTQIPDLEDKNSFAGKLKGLFAEKLKKDKRTSSEKVASFKLKSQDEEVVKEIEESKEEKAFTFKLLKKDSEKIEEPVEVVVQPVKEHIEEEKEEVAAFEIPKEDTEDIFSMIKGLGLDREDEIDVIKDFINESKINSDLIKEFIINKNFEKMLYALIKIKSSAEILHVNSIVKIAKEMQKECEAQNIEQVSYLNNKLSQNIKKLDKQLKADAI